MLYSKMFGKTVREAPSDAVVDSYKLLHRGGFIRESAAGRYFFLPLGQKVQQNIIKVVKEEMDSAGAQEMVSPVLHPLELWKETNRTNTAGFELMKVKDRRDAEFALGGTAEEMFVDVVRKFQISYKDLPFNIYQFSNKFRDELRARGGLLRVREFIMKDGYSFHRDVEDFKKEYENMRNTYQRIFTRLGLETTVVESDNGYIGGEYCHEFIMESPVGESTYLTTADGSYAAHEDVALCIKDEQNSKEKEQNMEEIDAVRGTTMEDGVALHKKPLWQQIKDVLYVDEKKRFILAIIRGDFDVNETKLKHIIKAVDIRHATEEEIRNNLHSEPGFISPVGIKESMEKGTTLIIVADDSLRTVKNAYGGANKKNRDLVNVNIDRDYQPDQEADIALVTEGRLDVKTKQPLLKKRGIEVGNIFQLGYHYSHLMKHSTFIDQDGKEKPYYMGCYGIGIGRTLAAVVEKYHDEKGITWPKESSPYRVHLVGLDMQDQTIKDKAIALYHSLQEKKVDVLFDDREGVSPGIKFSDADTIGVPVRIVISKRTGDQVEWKNRTDKKFELLSVADCLARIGSI